MLGENLIPALRPETEEDRIRKEQIAVIEAERKAEYERQVAAWRALSPEERKILAEKDRQEWLDAPGAWID